jgi:hypothetical protein
MIDKINALRDWLLKNEVSVSDPIFVEAVAHTFENLLRDIQAPVSFRTNSSPTTLISRSLSDSIASTAA